MRTFKWQYWSEDGVWNDTGEGTYSAHTFESFTERMKQSGFTETREVILEPTQKNAPLINEGGETVETHENNISVALLKKDDFRDEVFDIMSNSESGYYSAVDKSAAANQIADLYHAQATTLQTALAEANNKIAELERRLTSNNHE